ncbi:hypothetical protein [Phocaeicola sartorii]|uniref:hypothetical protein n=1 Tax=Phocaeicola sartorii TaxID=671267 RepID=UPI0011116687|nr:hypothetical protein [Phocaeicola sartorii]MCR1845605.1 hypothetical protein [Phocaeicola sartorii]
MRINRRFRQLWKNSWKVSYCRKEQKKWWQQPFSAHKRMCCHHPSKRPVHGGFSEKGGSSGSTFAKLREGGLGSEI